MNQLWYWLIYLSSLVCPHHTLNQFASAINSVKSESHFSYKDNVLVFCFKPFLPNKERGTEASTYPKHIFKSIAECTVHIIHCSNYVLSIWISLPACIFAVWLEKNRLIYIVSFSVSLLYNNWYYHLQQDRLTTWLVFAGYKWKVLLKPEYNFFAIVFVLLSLKSFKRNYGICNL